MIRNLQTEKSPLPPFVKGGENNQKSPFLKGDLGGFRGRESSR